MRCRHRPARAGTNLCQFDVVFDRLVRLRIAGGPRLSSCSASNHHHGDEDDEDDDDECARTHANAHHRRCAQVRTATVGIRSSVVRGCGERAVFECQEAHAAVGAALHEPLELFQGRGVVVHRDDAAGVGAHAGVVVQRRDTHRLDGGAVCRVAHRDDVAAVAAVEKDGLSLPQDGGVKVRVAVAERAERSDVFNDARDAAVRA
mmetsp:Transcript_21702/g.67385  ORF Transcript_21702/g.67385 Transcript_21702/m.67385 type:complete len:204 (+) Transcript_21702:694-1305(+)